MLGHNHVITGVAAGIGLLAINEELRQSPTLAITTVALTAGAAALPDIDHRGSTVSRSMYPLGFLVSSIIGPISGGHRKGTHTPLGWMACSLAAYGMATYGISHAPAALSRWYAGDLYWGQFLIVAFLTGIAITALKIDIFSAPSWIIGAGVGALTLTTRIDPIMVARLVGLGSAIHCLAGDIFTTAGIPNPLWPICGGTMRVPFLGTTGSSREYMYSGLTLAGACIALAIAW